MAKKDKRAERLRRKPTDFTWDELERLFKTLGYEPAKHGKTGGSRRRFVHPDAATISLHQPHPGNILKRYQVEQILETLTMEGLL